MQKPIVVHMLWIGDKLRQLEIECLRSHVDVGHEVRLWCYSELDAPTGVSICAADHVLPRSSIFTYQRGPGKGSYAAFANLFRYKVLRDRGGWWSDADIYCLRPWDLGADHVFCAEPEGVLLHNGVIKAGKDSEAMDACYTAAAAIGPHNLCWGQTGARLLTSVVDKLGLREFVVPSRTFCPVTWRNTWQLFTDTGFRTEPDLSGSYGVHLFNEMLRRHSIDVDAHYRLYEQLKAQQEVG